ncbi:MAG TPA: hypothetical protein EYN96_03495 [Candidatus Hydrogenedentes bacterium]|nr:hypothetical protein [Candidatus Hydrogenedentota bacterium]HIB54974.1 hypothetical protein [Nitrospirales bacterium]HIO22428.1 hypothetical protein [Nitrospirales bacterium]
MKIHLYAFGLLLLCSWVGTSYAADPSGTWRWEHEDLEGSGEMVPDVLDITVENNTVSGTYMTPDAELPVENASIDGDTLHFELNIDTPDGNLNLAWTGTISGDDVTGTIKFGDFGEFPWEAKRDAVANALGTWRWEHDDPTTGGTIKDVLTIRSADGEVGGTYKMGDVSYEVKNGKLDGNTLSWEFELDADGQLLNIRFSGVISGDEVTGTVNLDQFGEFPWAGTRDPAGDEWILTLSLPDGSERTDRMMLSEIDGQYSGTYHADGIDVNLEDFTVDDTGSFSFTVNVPEIGLTSEFSGTSDGDNATGVIEFDAGGQSGEVAFTAKRTVD